MGSLPEGPTTDHPGGSISSTYCFTLSWEKVVMYVHLHRPAGHFRACVSTSMLTSRLMAASATVAGGCSYPPGVASELVAAAFSVHFIE